MGLEQKNWKFSKYGHIIYHLKAFLMLIDNFIRTKVLKSSVKKLLIFVSLVFRYRILKKQKLKRKEINPREFFNKLFKINVSFYLDN